MLGAVRGGQVSNIAGLAGAHRQCLDVENKFGRGLDVLLLSAGELLKKGNGTYQVQCAVGGSQSSQATPSRRRRAAWE